MDLKFVLPAIKKLKGGSNKIGDPISVIYENLKVVVFDPRYCKGVGESGQNF